LPAKTIEGLVSDALVRFLGDKARLIDCLQLGGCTPDQLQVTLGKAEGLVVDLQNASTVLRDLILRVDLETEQVRISLDAGALFAKIGGGPAPSNTNSDLCLTEQIRLKKRGVESKLVLADGQSTRATPDPTLIRLVSQAHCWFEELKTGRARSNQDIIKQYGVDHADVARVLPLALLAPDIIEDILEGRQPPELTATRLKRMTDLPLSWEEQRQILGFS
jgi:hypothetical protein